MENSVDLSFEIFFYQFFEGVLGKEFGNDSRVKFSFQSTLIVSVGVELHELVDGLTNDERLDGYVYGF